MGSGGPQAALCTMIDPAIELPPRFGAVVGARFELAAADGADSVGRDAERAQLVAHRRRPPLGERLIVAVGADRGRPTIVMSLRSYFRNTSASLYMVGLKAGLIVALPKSNEISLDIVSLRRSSRTRSRRSMVGPLAGELLAQLSLLAVHEIADARPAAAAAAPMTVPRPRLSLSSRLPSTPPARAPTPAPMAVLLADWVPSACVVQASEQNTEYRAHLDVHSRFLGGLPLPGSGRWQRRCRGLVALRGHRGYRQRSLLAR